MRTRTLSVIRSRLLSDLVVGIATGNLHWFKGDIRILIRRNENLPAVSIKDETIYCRMYACDFRFPLPNNGRVVRINVAEGNTDTINGVVYVTMTDGAAIDWNAYSQRINKLKEKGGRVEVGGTIDNITEIRFSYFGDM